MKKIIVLLFVSGILISFNSKSDKLEFSKFAIINESGEAGIKVDDGGNVEILGKKFGMISRDGILTDQNGKLVAKLSKDDLLKNKKGKTLVKIDREGKMEVTPGELIHWSENGVLMKGNEEAGMKIVPADQKSFQTASMILFLYLSVGLQ